MFDQSGFFASVFGFVFVLFMLINLGFFGGGKGDHY